MQTLDKTLRLRIDGETHEKLRRLAFVQNKSMSFFMRIWINEQLNRYIPDVEGKDLVL